MYICMNRDLAYLLGAIRDGSLPKPSNNKYEVTFACDWYRPWLTEIILNKVKNTFELPSEKIKIYEVWSHKSKKPYFRLKVYSKKLYQRIREFYPESNQELWTTPKIIKNSNLELQIEYIKGFYDAEGGCRNVERFLNGETKSMNCEVGIRCKHVKSPNEPLLFIRSILQKFDIKSFLRKTEDGLIITGKNNAYKFYKYFKPLHPRKRLMLKRLLQYYGVLVSVEA